MTSHNYGQFLTPSTTVMLFSYKTYILSSQNPFSLPLVTVTSFMYDQKATKAEVPCRSTEATVQVSHFNEVLVLHEIDGNCAAIQKRLKTPELRCRCKKRMEVLAPQCIRSVRKIITLKECFSSLLFTILV